VGIALNLAALCYYKYAGFLFGTIDAALGLGLPIPQILLPLAISFYTFQQIAYLCDAYDGLAEETSFANYSMFITFFPHLIAGPITHHKEMIPQFESGRIFRPQPQMFATGTTVFLIGLLKKVMIADTIAAYVDPVFSAAIRDDPLSMFEAWGGALAYTLQIYFDFSGYSDMAIGLGLLFGIRLPFNFDSPLKASSIIDYWARWHMTLTRFVTGYIYNPITLRISRRRMNAGKPMPKRGRMNAGTFLSLVALPTILAFLIIGIWHGAGWQFATFGLLHGIYLTVNQGWRVVKKNRNIGGKDDRLVFVVPSVLFTLCCVVVGLVFFRSPDVSSALRFIAAMLGSNGVEFHTTELLTRRQVGLMGILLAIVWFFPNTQEWLRRYPTGLGNIRDPGWLERKFASIGILTAWHPTPAFAVALGVVGFFALTRALSSAPSEFIYFNF
jgi:alginate O-acetyltransferase complex protein AlgI